MGRGRLSRPTSSGARADGSLGRGEKLRPPDMDELKIRVGDESVSGLLIRPERRQGALLVCAWCRRRNDPPKHGLECGGLAARGLLRFATNSRTWRRGRGDLIRRGSLMRPYVRRQLRRRDLRRTCRFRRGTVLRRADDIASAGTQPLHAVLGLAFLGFPLHPAGKPGDRPGRSSCRVQIPMLFVSGDRDALAELDLLETVVASLGDRATLHLVIDADHGLRVPAKSGRTPTDAEAEALDAIAEWMTSARPLFLPAPSRENEQPGPGDKRS